MARGKFKPGFRMLGKSQMTGDFIVKIAKVHSNFKHVGQFCIITNKKGKVENYHNTIAVVPPLSQYYRNIHVTYCNS